MYLASYPMPTLRDVRYAACEDFAFSFMLILGFLFRCLSEEGPCEPGFGEPSSCFGEPFPSRVCVRARAALTR